MNIEEKLLNGNKNYLRKINQDKDKLELAHSLINGQKPYAMIITCSDSRVIPEEIFDVSLGELFIIRTAGNVINEGELASIEYGIKHLNISYIAVMAHTNCGAIHASIHDEEGKYLSPIINRIKTAIKGEKDECEASMLNAIEQVKYIKAKFLNYKGIISPLLYDINTNQVTIIK